MLRTEVENQPVCAAADFNHTGIGFDWLISLENLTDAPRRSHHRANDLFFTPAQAFRLASLVSKLAVQRALRKFPLRGLSPTHLCAFVPLCGLKRLYFEANVGSGCSIRERLHA